MGKWLPWLLESCVLCTYHTVAYSRMLYVKCEWAWTASLNNRYCISLIIVQIRNVLPPWLLESGVLSTHHTVAYSRTLYVKCEWAWTASLNKSKGGVSSLKNICTHPLVNVQSTKLKSIRCKVPKMHNQDRLLIVRNARLKNDRHLSGSV